MFDLDAMIVPGESAAGIYVGQPAPRAAVGETPLSVENFNNYTKLDYGAVKLWVEEEVVTQIGLFNGYRGQMSCGVKIGSSLGEVHARLGTVVEDEDGNLIIEGSRGWCFETEEWVAGRQPEQNPDARISEIYVFAVTG